LLSSHLVKVPPEIEQLGPLVADHFAGISQNNGGRAVNTVVNIAQQDRMASADIKQLGNGKIGGSLVGVAQLLRGPVAD
jgi:hypothetical protein